MVSEPTHLGPQGTSSLIDLVLMSAPQTLHECETIPPLANSDHLGIHLQVKSSNFAHVRTKKRVVWRYAYADFDKAKEMLDSLDLDDILDPTSAEDS